MKSWVFILLVSLAACSPGLEPGEPTSNPLDLFDNSDPTEEDLDDLFRNQDPSASEETQSPGDGSRPPGSEEGLEPFPPFIGDGQNPSEVQSEPPTGPAPVDMEREEAEASELTPPPVCG